MVGRREWFPYIRDMWYFNRSAIQHNCTCVCMYVQDKHMITSVCACGLRLCFAFWLSVILRISLTLSFLIRTEYEVTQFSTLNRDCSAFRPCPSSLSLCKLCNCAEHRFWILSVRSQSAIGNKLKSIDFLRDKVVLLSVQWRAIINRMYMEVPNRKLRGTRSGRAYAWLGIVNLSVGINFLCFLFAFLTLRRKDKINAVLSYLPFIPDSAWQHPSIDANLTCWGFTEINLSCTPLQNGNLRPTRPFSFEMSIAPLIGSLSFISF